jgi:hypothetical protein
MRFFIQFVPNWIQFIGKNLIVFTQERNEIFFFGNAD